MERRIRLSALAAVLAMAGMATGCAWLRATFPPLGTGSPAPPPAAPAPAQAPETPSASADEPHVLTDLSTLSSADPIDPFGPQATVASNAPAATGAPAKSAASESAGAVRRVGDGRHPGEERLLNEKAARFDTLSMRVMDQLFAAIEELEATGAIARLRMPADLKPVVLAGTLNQHGKLVKLALEQHSGQAAVDQMMVRACKRALHLNNPPPEALTPEGNYQVRIEARIENFASVDQRHWTFKTYIGMALL